jgi:very-short-patch-repair endonuclease
MNPNTEQTKHKVHQLYTFLKKVNEIRFVPVRSLHAQEKAIRLAEMPAHPSIQLKRPIPQLNDDKPGQDFELRIKRPNLTPCPAAPRALSNWLLPGYDDPTKAAGVAQSLNLIVERSFDEDPQRPVDLEAFKQARLQEPEAHPPASIVAWLVDGWNVDGRRVEVNDKLTVTETVQFDADADRVSAFEQWKTVRSEWTVPELVARRAMAFYEQMYELYVRIEKDSENLELMVADGRFQWLGQSSFVGQVQIDHPILLKRAELRFDANIPEFVITETEREPELYDSLFLDLTDVRPEAIRSRLDELQKSLYHPLGYDDTSAFLRAFIQTVSPATGEYLEDVPDSPITATPRLYRDAVIVLRKRSRGVADAVSKIIDHIETQEVFPPALIQITGTEGGSWPSGGLSSGSLESDVHGSSGAYGNFGGALAAPPAAAVLSDEDILLAMEANAEQMQILRRLHTSGAVIVQGPPGTGKTHTIGNLIGHLLAQGKSILVTAHTAKALRVVRDKVPAMLRPLAVSVLGSDQNARAQLENAVGSISERMTGDSPESLQAKAHSLEAQRKMLLRRKSELKGQLLRAVENEYREIRVAIKSYSPAEAARHLREHKQSDSWIPGPVKLGADLTLEDAEVVRLYAFGHQFTGQEEMDCGHPLPSLDEIPSAIRFRVMVSEYTSLVTADLGLGLDRWSAEGGGSEALAAIAAQIEAEFSEDLRMMAWRPYAIVAGLHGAASVAVWDRLIVLIGAAIEAQTRYMMKMEHQPRVATGMPLAAQQKVVSEILDHLATGGKLGFMQLLTRGEWKTFIKSAGVASGEPSHKDHFDAIKTLIDLEVARQALAPLWDQLVGTHMGAPFASLGNAPEASCRAIIPEIERCIAWHASTWVPIEQGLRDQGLRLDDVMAALPREASPISEYQFIERLATRTLPPLLTTEVSRRKLAECEAGFAELEKLSGDRGHPDALTGCIGLIVSAVQERNVEAYVRAVSYARRLHEIKPLVDERKSLLKRLSLVAPAWAEQIAGRVTPHDQVKVPGAVMPAWIWRQLHDELQQRDSLNANEIQLSIDRVDETLREVTQLLIDAKAWCKQLERLKQNNSIRQALVGWLDTMKVLGSTRKEGRRQMLLSAARRQMKQCSEAVPVWIMPISIVAENFDPRHTTFDVVIIDEASQADLNALIPLYMGKQVIVVGDHEQVTPLGVGQGQDMLDNIRAQTLTDIPNSHLFDSRFSIYDIGRQSFGDAIRLVEHFRCVPEIISFSNQLSYEGKIRPLRESNSSSLKPACVALKVDGAREKDVNHREARQIVDMIKAMIEHPRYAGKTMGVLSMLGDSQAMLLQSMILKEISSEQIEARRIIAGSSSEFQGDERDVIFISLVDSAVGEGPMRLAGDGAFDLTKKRYNVAASRARDQIIVVHSFEPHLHLKPGDIRMRLMRHIEDPLASIRAFSDQVGRTDSPFERAVLKMLTDAGYKVRTQWPVGYYRIDMVVEGGGKRLAIECDGDRFHPIDQLAADIERQTILERLGWQFVRIRGSAFYRDADDAMKPVFERIRELEIPQDQDVGLADVQDRSLIHELEEIISRNYRQADLDSEDELEDIDATGDASSNDESRKMFEARSTDLEANTDDVEGEMTDPVELEHFIRQMAKAMGYVRLRQTVRDRVLVEIEKRVKSGQLVMEGDFISIRKKSTSKSIDNADIGSATADQVISDMNYRSPSD